ncbi:MAG: hypothetical protein ACHQDC_07370 [Acidimicrobiales bacterium]|jgi:hypothetical protein
MDVQEGTPIATAVAEVQMLVQGDGARFDWVPSPADDPVDDKVVHLRLDLTEVGCLDCVLPPGMLVDIVQTSIRRSADDDSISVEIDDPRNSDGS